MPHVGLGRDGIRGDGLLVAPFGFPAIRPGGGSGRLSNAVRVELCYELVLEPRRCLGALSEALQRLAGQPRGPAILLGRLSRRDKAEVRCEAEDELPEVGIGKIVIEVQPPLHVGQPRYPGVGSEVHVGR